MDTFTYSTLTQSKGFVCQEAGRYNYSEESFALCVLLRRQTDGRRRRFAGTAAALGTANAVGSRCRTALLGEGARRRWLDSRGAYGACVHSVL